MQNRLVFDATPIAPPFHVLPEWVGGKQDVFVIRCVHAVSSREASTVAELLRNGRSDKAFGLMGATCFDVVTTRDIAEELQTRGPYNVRVEGTIRKLRTIPKFPGEYSIVVEAERCVVGTTESMNECTMWDITPEEVKMLPGKQPWDKKSNFQASEGDLTIRVRLSGNARHQWWTLSDEGRDRVGLSGPVTVSNTAAVGRSIDMHWPSLISALDIVQPPDALARGSLADG